MRERIKHTGGVPVPRLGYAEKASKKQTLHARVARKGASIAKQVLKDMRQTSSVNGIAAQRKNARD